MADLARSLLSPRGPWHHPVLVVVGTTTAVTLNIALVAWLLAPAAECPAPIVRVPMFATATAVPAPPPAQPPPLVVAAPPPVATPVLLPPARFAVAPRACPPPRRDAPRITPPELDEAVARVTVAPSNAGWVAAWNHEHVFVSTDAGRHFTRVLDGAGVVSDVGFDCFGTVVAIREQTVGLRVGDAEQWTTIPGVDLMDMDEEPEGHAVVVSGGPEVIVIGRGDGWSPRIARSADLGGRWRYHDLTTDWETPVIHGRQREDGTIAISLPATDCAGEGEDIVTIRRGVIATGMGPGWWPGDGDRVELDDGPAGLPVDATWAGDGLARVGDALYRVRDGRATRLPLFAESDAYVADPAGRLWAVMCGRLAIAGRKPSVVRCVDAE